MFWELYQQMQISNAQGVAERAANDAITAKNNITLLEDKIACLALACQSLWEIVEQETDITREQLLAKMEEVDLRDGKKDGKLSPSRKTVTPADDAPAVVVPFASIAATRMSPMKSLDFGSSTPHH